MGQHEEDGAVDSAVPSIENLHKDKLAAAPIGGSFGILMAHPAAGSTLESLLLCWSADLVTN